MGWDRRASIESDGNIVAWAGPFDPSSLWRNVASRHSLNAEPATNSSASSSSEVRRWYQRVPWQMFWALADQGVVSVARMATSILVGRYGSKEELGLYTLGFTLLTLVISLQEALVTTPYTIFVARYPRDQQPSFSGHLFLFSKLLTLVTMFLLAISILIAFLQGADPQLLMVMGALLLILPFSLLKEFSRRWQVAHLKMVEATAIDSLNSLILLGCLFGLCYFQSITAVYAFLATGIAGLAASLTWGIYSRREFQFRWSQFKHTMRSCLHYGKWVAGENFLSVIQYFFGNWFLFLILSTQEVGNYAGCMTIVMLSNPFLLGVTGLLSTRSSRAFAEQGEAAVRQLVSRYLVAIVGIMVAFSVVIFFAGQWLLDLVFKGEIQQQGWTIALLSWAMVGLGASYITSCGLRAINRPEVNYYGSLLGLLVTAGVSFLAWSYVSPQMSAGAFLAGTSSMALFRIWAFYRPAPPAASAVRV